MSDQISSRDWEKLSAYMDGQLSPRMHARMEARLRQEPELRSALEELRQTKAVLSALPRIRAPRNFTLTPEMVGEVERRPRLGLFSTFRLASAMASFLLLIVLVGDILGLGMAMPGFQRAAEPTEVVALMQEVPAAEEEMVEEPAPLEIEQEEELQFESPMADVAEPEAAEEEMVEESQPLAVESGEVITPSITEEALGVSKIPEPGESVIEGDTTEEALENTLTPRTTEIAELEPQEEPLPMPEEDPERLPEPRPGISILRGVEISLAAIAVFTGLAALYFRRRG